MIRSKRFALAAALCLGAASYTFAGPSCKADSPCKAGKSSQVQAQTTAAKSGELASQTTCPVMKGKPINKELYVDHDGKRIYVCCAGCIDPIKKDPAKYIQKLEKMGQSVESIPAEI